jgi:hypothetical protein
MRQIEPAKTEQTGQPLKRNEDGITRPLRPKADEIERRKKGFIKQLSRNGGNVSDALNKSGLARYTAYAHLKTDKEFAELWQEALETSYDELFAEARRRAVEGEICRVRDDKGKVYETRKKSDTLLIFLIKMSEARLKWRGRIVQTGNLALNTVRTAGTEAGLTEEQILHIQEAMRKDFKSVSLL